MAPPPDPPKIAVIEVDVPLQVGEPPTAIQIPANTPAEAFRMLYETGSGSVVGSAARTFYYGSVLEPIRDAYKIRLEQVEREILRRRAALGVKPTEYELRGLAQWAARQRANTARVWRLPTPALSAGLEARDWHAYDVGGRTFENLLKRSAVQGRTGTAALENIIGSAARSNAEVNASVARGARFLRGGGAILGVAGLAVSAYEIAQAPANQRAAVAERQAAGFAGGLIGSEMAAGVLAVGAGFLAASPPGWVVIGIGLVGGFAGGIIADRVFFPHDHAVIARQMGAGYAVVPEQYSASNRHPVGTTGVTLLPVVQQVVITIQRGDTQLTLSSRAYLQAALSVGLSPEQVGVFVARYASPSGLRWIAGDPSPRTDAAMRSSDLAVMVGKQVVFELNPAQRDELFAMTGT